MVNLKNFRTSQLSSLSRPIIGL